MALAIKYVDDVVIGAPYILTEDFLLSLNIKKVVHVITDEDTVKPEYRHIDPYVIPKEQKIKQFHPSAALSKSRHNCFVPEKKLAAIWNLNVKCSG